MNEPKLISHGRPIDYLRLSITDKCNLRCRYCMPEEGIDRRAHTKLMRAEEMRRIVGVFVEAGIRKLRITGGEPLVSKMLLPLLDSLKSLPLTDIALTTNGQLLPQMADKLLAAGVKRLNISLDTLDQQRFAWISRGGELQKTLDGIDAAFAAGFNPVKVNTVVVRGFNDDEVVNLALLAKNKPVSVRFIELMPVGEFNIWSEENFVSTDEIKTKLACLGQLQPTEVINGNGPAEVFCLEGFCGTIGFINAISGHFCRRCNRLRLTSDGKIFPCLHSDCSFDLLTALRQGATDAELLEVIEQAVECKPPEHSFGKQLRGMNTIGG